jgi:hypothetical protein
LGVCAFKPQFVGEFLFSLNFIIFANAGAIVVYLFRNFLR